MKDAIWDQDMRTIVASLAAVKPEAVESNVALALRYTEQLEKVRRTVQGEPVALRRYR